MKFRVPSRSTADPAADDVFLLVQSALFALRDMAAVLASHIAFFLTNLTVIPVQIRSLGGAEIARFDLILNPRILIRQARIDFSAARMIFFPCRGGVGLASCLVSWA